MIFRNWFILLLSLGISACADHSRNQFDIPSQKKINPENEYLAALSLLSDAIKNNPSDAENYYKRAKLQADFENYNDALIDITRAEKLNPNSGLFLYFKAKIEDQLNIPTALKNAQLAERQNFDSPDLYILISNLYLKQKQFNNSQKYMRKAEEAYPYNSDLFLLKGNYYAAQNDTLTAINNFKRALSLTPHKLKPYDFLIKIYNSSSLPDSALMYNEKALKRFPNSRELLYNKARILENVGSLDSATKVYKSFLLLEPDRFDVLEKVGDIYFRKKNYAAAFLIFDKLGKAQPKKISAFKKAALCYEVQEKYTDAKNYLEKSLSVTDFDKDIEDQIMRLSYIIDTRNNLYSAQQSNLENENSGKKSKNRIEVVEPQRRLFDANIGAIEKIQKRNSINIRKDSTRN
jgi:tetratricopeptide (TPR) repeat protein